MSATLQLPTTRPAPTGRPRPSSALDGGAVALGTGYGPRYRLTRRGRFVAVVLGVLLTLACGIAYATGSAASGDGRHDTRVVVVQPGQSLWTIASAAGGGHDVDVMIERLESINHLTGAEVQAGQRLRVPTDG